MPLQCFAFFRNLAMTLKLRITLFVLLCVGCIVVSIGYVMMRARQPANPSAGTGTAFLIGSENGPGLPAGGAAVSTPPSLPTAPFLLFRTTTLGKTYGQLVAAPLDHLSGPVTPTGLSCERAYFSGGYGVCLTADRGVVTSYQAFIFDSSLKPRHKLPLQGIPSRTRVSPDGRLASITVFVSGDSYVPGSFSTRTEVFRTDDGSKIAELEKFTVERDGKPFRAVDFNFWGVTFANDGHHFYATLATGGQNYLIEGDLTTQHAQVLHSGVECPSLAPNGKRVAFKRPTRSGWHIYVLDLDSDREIPLAETRSVDDQVVWLDNDRILYALERDIWVMPADGSGTPSVFLTDAYSPAVIR